MHGNVTGYDVSLLPDNAQPIKLNTIDECLTCTRKRGTRSLRSHPELSITGS